MIDKLFKRYFLIKIRQYHKLFPFILLSGDHLEFLFGQACKASRRSVSWPASRVHCGEDMTVDGENLSIKSEASKKEKIRISKLLEASWWTENPYSVRRAKIISHLKKYKRIFILRGSKGKNIEYEMVEISTRILLNRIKNLTEEDWSEPTKKMTQAAKLKINKKEFRIRYDGTCRKIIIENFPVSECIRHAVWKL